MKKKTDLRTFPELVSVLGGSGVKLSSTTRSKFCVCAWLQGPSR